MKGILTLPENDIVSELEIEIGKNQEDIYTQVCKNISAETLDCRSVDYIGNQYHLIMYADDNGYEKNLSPNAIASLIYSNGKDKQCIRGAVVFIMEHIITGMITSLDINIFNKYLEKRKIF